MFGPAGVTAMAPSDDILDDYRKLHTQMLDDISAGGERMASSKR